MIARSWLCIGDFRSFTRSSPAPGSGICALPRWTTSAGSPKELIRTARMHCPLQNQSRLSGGLSARSGRTYDITAKWQLPCWRLFCQDLVQGRFQAPEKTRGERLGPFATNDLIAADASLLA